MCLSHLLFSSLVRRRSIYRKGLIYFIEIPQFIQLLQSSAREEVLHVWKRCVPETMNLYRYWAFVTTVLITSTTSLSLLNDAPVTSCSPSRVLPNFRSLKVWKRGAICINHTRRLSKCIKTDWTWTQVEHLITFSTLSIKLKSLSPNCIFLQRVDVWSSMPY